jgi:hypothetical protein
MTPTQIALLLLVSIFLLAVFWGVGRWLLLFFCGRDEMTNALPVSVVSGFTALTIVYSIVKSDRFNTLSVVVLVIALIWLVLRKKSDRAWVWPGRADVVPDKKEVTTFLFFLFFFGLIFFAQFIKLDALGGTVIPVGGLDFPFYITIAEQLNARGIENTLNYLNQLDSVAIAAAQPYHFFDLWFDALLLWIVPSNPVFVYLFVFIPMIVFFGFLMLVNAGNFFVQRMGRNFSQRQVSILSFGLLFLVGYFPYSRMGFHGFEFLDAPLFSNPKFYYSYFLLGIGIPMFYKRAYLDFSFVLLMVSFFYILYLPIAGCLMALCVLVEWRKSGLQLMNGELRRSLLMFAGGALLMGLFYFLQPREVAFTQVNSVGSSHVVHSMLQNFTSVGSLYHFVRAYAVKVIYFLPFIFLLLMVLWKKASRREVLVAFLFPVVLVFIGGFLSFAFKFHIEGWQFLAQCYSAGLYFGFLWLLLKVLTEKWNIAVGAGLLLVLLQSVASVYMTLELGSESYPVVGSAFKKGIEDHHRSFSPVGLYLAAHHELKSSSREISPYLNYFTGFVKFNPNTWLIQASDVSPQDLNVVSPEFRDIYLTSPFQTYRTVHHQAFPESIRAFMAANKISFIVWNEENVAITPYLGMIDHTITDPVSGFSISFCKGK